MKDYYDILQVSPNAEPEVVGAAYRRLARKYHPDAYAGPDATERMRELNEAYEVLSDPAKRAEYDRARHYARRQARRAESEAPGRPPREQGPEPAKAARTAPAEPSKRRTIPVVFGLLGLIVLGVGIGTGVWIAMGVVDEGDDTSFGGATDLSDFAKDWWHHGFVLSIDIDGQSNAEWRVYKFCSDDPSPPCDRIENNMIIGGGSATLVFNHVDGPTAFGRVVTSSDQLSFAPGSEVSLTLLPYDMATLRRGLNETTLCGPNYADLAPKSIFETHPCGA